MHINGAGWETRFGLMSVRISLTRYHSCGREHLQREGKQPGKQTMHDFVCPMSGLLSGFHWVRYAPRRVRTSHACSLWRAVLKPFTGRGSPGRPYDSEAKYTVIQHSGRPAGEQASVVSWDPGVWMAQQCMGIMICIWYLFDKKEPRPLLDFSTLPFGRLTIHGCDILFDRHTVIKQSQWAILQWHKREA